MGRVLRILWIVALLLGGTVRAAAAAEESPPPSSEPGQHAVRVVAPGASYRVHGWTPGEMVAGAAPVRGRDSKLVPLCTTPCDLSLAPASYVLGLSTGEAEPIMSLPFRVTDTTRELVATVDPRTQYREGGLMLGMTSILAGVLLLTTAVSEPETECEQWDMVSYCSTIQEISLTRIFFGLSLAIGGGITGFRMAASGPRAELQPR